MAGVFYGIGVGPGDPELVTLKAVKALEKCDTLCVPKAAGEKESLALNIARQAVAKDFRLLELLFPMTRDREVLRVHWREAARQVAARLKTGENVAFVTIGDPTFFSTYTYLLQELKEIYPEVQTVTVPGVPAFLACSAWAEFPLSEGEEKVAIIPAVGDLQEAGEVLDRFETVVFMKVNRRFNDLLDLLQEKGLAGKAIFFCRAGYPDGWFTSSLEELRDRELPYMSLLIVKKKGWER